jgi:RND family efflux transporter MFP subunit
MMISRTRLIAVAIAVVLIGSAVAFLVSVLHPRTPEFATATVERGTVRESVSVSGFVEAKHAAELGFPSSGKVTAVYAEEGKEVKAGDVLATLASDSLVAQRTAAVASLNAAEASYAKLLAGASAETRQVAQTSLANAQQELARTKAEEKKKVENARQLLLSSGLEAVAEDPDETATAPVITGSYLCESEGNYRIEVYRSNAYTDYSYSLSGLETGSASIATDQPAPLGSCGLRIQFTGGDRYDNSVWIVSIPNTQGVSYVANKNAYDLAMKQEENAVAAATDAAALVGKQTAEVNADPRSEEVRAALADITAARAKVDEVSAEMADRSIVAPFDGVITDVSILAGETAGASPVITLLSSDAFEMKARIPEIDVRKITQGQHAEIVFDAQSDTTYTGSITYLSPLATVIDGVAYFEATIALDAPPAWIRAGLNADVDIITAAKENVLRIPKRFLIEEKDGTYSVLTPEGNGRASTTVSVGMIGNDGYAEITGINEGQSVIAP